MSVGSAREFASRDNLATFGKFRCRRDPGFPLLKTPAGTLQNWPCYRGIYPQKELKGNRDSALPHHWFPLSKKESKGRLPQFSFVFGAQNWPCCRGNLPPIPSPGPPQLRGIAGVLPRGSPEPPRRSKPLFF